MSQSRSAAIVPPSPFPVLPLRTGVLLPGTVITLPVGRERSVALLESIQPGAIVGVISQRDPAVGDPTESDLHRVGTFARVVRFERGADRVYRVVLEGMSRFHLDRLTGVDPFWKAEGRLGIETRGDGPEAHALADALREQVEQLSRGGAAQPSFADDEPGRVADRIAAALDLELDKGVEVLATMDIVERLQLVARLLTEAKTMADLRQKIDSDVRRELNKNQREALLREQMKAIKREIGDDKEDDADALKERLAKADLPDEVRTVVDRELRRLDGGAQGPEANVIRTYLEWIADLPWKVRAEAKGDLDAVARKLDEDHFGLDDVKKRVLEHMAVLSLSGNPRGSILCFAGPPGVGKTSLGQSIADATGRPFVRISLGGVRDEAEIRGHRRTYVGALPGRIVHALRKVKVANPVILLDEIDKLGSGGWNGSPEHALLELLDPEQNRTFTDHYLELPFDLSSALFICTVNDLSQLSAPLRDRLEIIEISGYTTQEKIHIAREHLVPRALKDHAIAPGGLVLADTTIETIARDYTREAGVRQLNREITRLCRALALEIVRGKRTAGTPVTLDDAEVVKHLGRAKFTSEVAERTSVPGVATGLAWTPVGGDILFIETSRMPGKGLLETTGQLGDVMKESAHAALTFVRSNAERLGISPRFLENQDVHIHVPAGGTPKDGPSAGVTMFTALTSLLTGRRVRSDTAMTGECTLRGRVMPVGGIKVKVLAAHRAGIKRVVLPAKNARDLDDVPREVRDTMEFILADDMHEVLAAALEPQPISLGANENGRTESVRNAA